MCQHKYKKADQLAKTEISVCSHLLHVKITLKCSEIGVIFSVVLGQLPIFM